MTTLRRERIQKFKEIIKQSEIYSECDLQWKESYLEEQVQLLAESLADASISRSEIAEEYKASETLHCKECGYLTNPPICTKCGTLTTNNEEEARKYNAPVFRGDWRDYPEHLHKIAECLRDVWMFDLPDKPKKKSNKGHYAFWIMSMDELKQACAEFGVTALVKAHEKWRAGFKNGIAPFTVATPQSLIKYTASIVLEMRQSGISDKPQGRSMSNLERDL